MTDKPARRTQARIAERERRRRQEEWKERLEYLLPLAAAAILLPLGLGLYFWPSLTNSGAVNGANGAHFQANTEKIDLGDEPLGKTVNATFDIQNTGDGTLTLTVPQIASVLEGC